MVCDARLKKIWNQNRIPVVFRRERRGVLCVRLPYASNNRVWLQDRHHAHPEWNSQLKYWVVPAGWCNELLRRLIQEHGAVYFVHPFNVLEVCAPACWNAVGAECECSCMGEHHGSGEPAGRWHIVSEIFAAQWGPRKYSCRLLNALP